MSDANQAAQEIMALVDEFPSEPFSYERRIIEEKLTDFISRHTQQMDDELDSAFRIGLEEGESQGYNEAKDEYETRIQELDEELAAAKEEKQINLDDAFTEGYEAAKLEYGIH